MNKLRVGQTIFDAYNFTFTHLGTIIGLIWVPLVILTLLNFLPELAGDGGDSGGMVAMGTREVENLAVSLLTLLLYAIIYVAVTRQALGIRQGSALYHFALGPPEFRVFGAVLAMGLALAVFALLYILIALAAAAVAKSQGAPGALLAAAVVFAGALALIFTAVRLSFLVTPVTVVENHIDLARGWRLTRGNFWRIFLVLLAISLPLLVVEAAATIFLMGRDIAAALPSPAESSDPQSLQQHMLAIQSVLERHMSELMGISLVLAPFSLALSLSASAYAYRELAGTPIAARNAGA